MSAQQAAHDGATLEQHCQLWEVAHGQHVSRDPMRCALACWFFAQK
jgi:hypothetical protein